VAAAVARERGETAMNGKTIGYWVTTAMTAFVLTSGGLAMALHNPENVKGVVELGYPAYFVTLLGAWKTAGGVVLLAPKLARLKEWAYAGAIFDFTAAAYSQAAMHHETFHVVMPLVLTIVAMISWALRPESRVVGTIAGAST
jgi:hypothetical protein